MIGLLTAGRKAVTYGYKRYGVPGAIAGGGLVVVGYVAIRRAIDAAADSERINEVVDVETLQSAVADDGLEAITDPSTLERAVDPDNLGSTIAMDDVQSEDADEPIEFAPDELDDFTPDETEPGDDSSPES